MANKKGLTRGQILGLSLLCILAVCVIASFVFCDEDSSADPGGKCGENLTWTYNIDNKKLTISGTGDMYNYSVSDYPWIDYRAEIQILEQGFESDITWIDRDAFYGCDNLSNVQMRSNSVYEKHNGMLYIKASNTLYWCPEGLSGSVSIYDSTTVIDSWALCNCYKLTGTLTIPKSVTSIGNNAFEGCTGLTGLALGSNITHIGDSAFHDCDNITVMTIPSTVKGIDENAFNSHHFYEEDGWTGIASRAQGFVGYSFQGINSLEMVRNGHRVTYNVNGGSEPAPASIVKGYEFSFTVASYSGTKDGYIFGGWTDGSGAPGTYMPGDEVKMGSKDLTLVAKWIPMYSVSYDVGEGSLPAPDSYSVEEGAIIEVADYKGTKDGYKFGGWSYNYETYQPGSKLKMGNSNIVFTAVWVPLHHVTYKPNQGLGPVPTQADVAEGDTFIVATYTGSREGWVFGGWEYNEKTYIPGSVFTMGTNDVELTAIWYLAGCGYDLYWNYNLETNVLTISGTGAMYDYTSGWTDLEHIYGLAPWHRYMSKCVTIELSPDITSIGDYAFYQMEHVTSITIPAKVTSIGEFAFSECSALKDVTFQEGLQTIGKYAFAGLSNIDELQIPATVTSVGEGAFMRCSGIEDTTISISKNLTSIGDGAFAGLVNVTAFSVALDNPSYKSVDGVIYNTSGTILLQYPAGKDGEYTVSDDVKTIGQYAFRSSAGLTRVILGSGITSIGFYAFEGCTGLLSVTVPLGIYGIDAFAFNSHTFFDENGIDVIKVTEAKFLGATFIGMSVDKMVRQSTVTHTVSYDENGGTIPGPSSEQISPGTKFQIPDYKGTKAGYKFAGWSFEDTTYAPEQIFTMPDKDVTFVAVWGNAHTVVYDVAGGDHGAPASITVEPGQSFTVASYDGKNGKKVFDGWSYNGEKYLPGQVVVMGDSDITFVARWSNKCGDNLYWNYFAGTLTISVSGAGSGLMTDYSEPELVPWYDYRASITILDLKSGITSIGKNAFYECSGITWLEIPSGVTYISDFAFYGCSGFSNVQIPASVKDINACSFEGCTGITVLYLADGIETIGPRAFYGCSNIVQGLSLPNTITQIGANAFTGCANITSIGIPKGVTGISASAFGSHTFYEEDGTTVIESRADGFVGYTYLGLTADKMIRNGYFVNYDNNGGSTPAPESIVVGLDTLFTLAPYDGTIDGYKFGGWKYNDHIYQPGDNVQMLGSNMTFKAIWVLKHSVTYDIAGGSGVAPVQSDVAEGDSFTVAAYDGTKEGFTFGGWSYNDHTYKAGDSITVEKSDITLTAIWNSDQKHHVTYDIAGGSGVAPTQADVAEGDSFTVAAYDGTKEGFIFGGWLYDDHTYNAGDSITMGTSDITLTAIWDAVQKHSVTYDIAGGSGVAPTQADVAEGDSFTVAAYDGTKEGFTFGGWDYNATTYHAGDKILMGTSDITLTAIWTDKPTHNVTYDLDGGTGPTPTQDPVKEGETFKAAVCEATKAGYYFGGWTYNSITYDPGDVVLMGTSDITLRAVWKENAKHSVTYNENGGSDPAPVQADVAEGASFIVQDYTGTKEGFIFGGWKYDETIYVAGSSIVMGTSDIVLIAEWTDKPYHEINYDVDGGSEPAPTQDPVKEGETFKAAPYSGTRAGFTFDGWIHDGTVYMPGDDVKMGTDNLTLRAVWKENPKHSVTYNEDGGSEPAPKQEDVAEGLSFIVQAYAGTKEGFTFGGWKYDGKVYNADDSIVMGTSDIVLAAVWNEIPKHSVTYDVDGGSEAAPIQADVIEGASFIVQGYTGTKAGFTFGGWTYNATIYNAGDSIVMGTSNITLTAVWNDKPYHEVNYDVDGGSEPAPVQAPVKEDMTFKAAPYDGIRAGFTFGGWIHDGTVYEPGDDVKMGTENLTLRAVWKPNPEHKVVYDLNGGTGVVPEQDPVREGMTFVVQACAATKADFEFKGWAYDGANYSAGDVITMGTTDIKLSAMWMSVGKEVKVEVSDDSAPMSSDMMEEIKTQAAADPDSTATFILDSGTVVFDSAAISTLDDTKAATLAVQKIPDEELPPDVKAIVSDGVAINMDFGDNKNFGAGTVTITVPFVLKPGQKAEDIVVYYIADGVVKESFVPTYDSGFITFTTSHFSTYAIASSVYKVEYKLGGATWITGYEAPVEYTYGEGLELPAADKVVPYKKEGYTVTFAGWYLTSDPSKTIVSSIPADATGDKSFTASFTESADPAPSGGSDNTIVIVIGVVVAIVAIAAIAVFVIKKKQ